MKQPTDAVLKTRRQASLAAAKKISAQARQESAEDAVSRNHPEALAPTPPRILGDGSDEDESAESTPHRPKKRKLAGAWKDTKSQLSDCLFGASRTTSYVACLPPKRQHTVAYHRPLLLDGQRGKFAREALLDWFATASTARSMPWRKAWLNPDQWLDPDALRTALERRAYEVWISEIMLQQTRVSVVIDYWNRWMAKWPTIQDLAAADPEHVMGAWQGLGYYSRAKRIHEAAKLVVDDQEMRGLLPGDATVLETKVPGVGRYTGGAISAIVFGHAAPMVDGNVLRVLSRQLGILGNVKTDKSVIGILWAAADVLVKAVAEDASDQDNGATRRQTSDRPGRWGQALMELGSTLCTPKPNCSVCPISSTCRAYGEGRRLACAKGLHLHDAESVADIEAIDEVCILCKPSTGDVVEGEAAEFVTALDNKTKDVAPKQRSSFWATTSTASKGKPDPNQEQQEALGMVIAIDHARKFPLRTIKKAVREEETLVCAIRRSDGYYLIHRRPERGLLAGLWELPSRKLPESNDSKSSARGVLAKSYAAGLVEDGRDAAAKSARLKHVGEIGRVPWLFSHLKLTMFVHFFELQGVDRRTNDAATTPTSRSRWVSREAVDEASMGTGMRKCWSLLRENGTR